MAHWWYPGLFFAAPRCLIGGIRGFSVGETGKIAPESVRTVSLDGISNRTEVNRRLQELPGCLQKLTDQQRALLERCYQRPGSIKAIAEASQLDPNTLYKQLERIRRDLFECIEQAATVE